MTIHKSQGSTFSHPVFVDIGEKEVLGSSFVGMSRVTSFENLILKPFDFERFEKIKSVGYFKDRKLALEKLEEIEFAWSSN